MTKEELRCAGKRNFAESQLQRRRYAPAAERGKAEPKVVPSI